MGDELRDGGAENSPMIIVAFRRKKLKIKNLVGVVSKKETNAIK